MRFSCPNLSDEQYKILESFYGPNGAVSLYNRYDGKVPQVRFDQGLILKENNDSLQSKFNTAAAFTESIDIPTSLFINAIDGYVEPAVSEETQEETVEQNVVLNRVQQLFGTTVQSEGLLYDTISQLKDFVDNYEIGGENEYPNFPIPVDISGILSKQNLGNAAFEGFLDELYGVLDIIQENWLDKNGVRGYRHLTKVALKEFGWNIEDSVIEEDESNDTSESDEQDSVDMGDDLALAEKNYSISNFEVDPASTVSQEIKRLLQNIENFTPNRYGFVTKIPISRIYSRIQMISKNKNTFSEIIKALEERAAIDQEMVPVVNAIRNFSGAQKAQFFQVFRLDQSNLEVMEVKYGNEVEDIAEEDIQLDKDGNPIETKKTVTTNAVKFISLNSQNPSSILFQNWKSNMLGNSITATNPHLYTAVSVDDKTLYDVNRTTTDGKDRVKSVKEQITIFNNSRDQNEKARALGSILWDLGINIASSRELNSQAIQNYINGDRGKVNEIYNYGVKNIINKVFEVTSKGNQITDIRDVKSSISNPIFNTDAKQLVGLSKILGSVYTSDVAASILNAKGNLVFPINKPTPMTSKLNDINNATFENLSQTYQDMSADISLNPSEQHKSILLTVMGKGAGNNYPLETKQFSGQRQEDSETSEAKEYSDLTPRDHLIVLLNQFLNGGESDMFAAIPTQESRDNFAFIKVPKLALDTAKSSFEQLTGKTITKKEVIEAIIVRDLMRINRDLTIYENNRESQTKLGFKDYHINKKGPSDEVDKETRRRINFMNLEGTENVDVDGVRLSFMMPDMIKYGRIETYNKYWDVLDQMVDNYIENVLPQKVESVMQVISDYNITSEKNINTEALRRGYAGDMNKFIESFVFNTIVYRIELTGLFRGSAAYFKSIEDLYKRWGLLNTPGSQLLIKGQDVNNPDFGMFEEFNQVAFEDFGTVLEDFSQAYQDVLVAQGLSTERAASIAKNYARGVAKGTDSLAIISPEMFKAIMEGGGGPFAWTAEHEKMYQDYQNGGDWAFDLTPGFKYFYDNTSAHTVAGNKIYASELDKNAWFVLTRNAAKSSPVMADMLEAMNGKYTDGKPVHLFNAASAKKGIASNVFTIDFQTGEATGEYFRGIIPTVQKASKLVEPQTMSTKAKEQIRYNTQIRRHVITNINREGRYNFDGQDISGQELFDLYSKTIYAKLSNALEETIDEVGLGEYLRATTEAEKGLAKTKILAKIAQLTTDSKMRDGKFDVTIEKQLKIVRIGEFDVDFALPAGFPTNERDLMAQFIGVFRQKVAKFMVPGFEAVQVGSMGKFNINGELRELKFYEPTNESTLYAEVALSEDILERMGIKVGDELDLSDPAIQQKLMFLGYRIPHQSLASTIVLKVAVALPKSYKKHIIVPANFVQATGSDFDWDKLYIILQETDQDGNIIKVNTPAKVAAQQPVEFFKGLSTEQLNNLIFNTNVAVSQSFSHLEETLSGVESANYAAIADELEKLKGGMDLGSKMDDPLLDIRMREKFSQAAKLIGLYANADSGFSAAVHGDLGGGKYGLKIDQSKAVNWDGEILDTIQSRSPLNEQRVNSFFTSHLSAALDVGGQEVPLQLRTNDNIFTAKASILLASVGVEQEDIIAFRMNPAVFEFTRLVTIENMTPYQAFRKLGLTKKFLEQVINNNNPTMQPMITEMLVYAIRENNPRGDLSMRLLKNFAIAYYGGSELYRNYRRLTPDTLDRTNDLSAMQEILEVVENVSAKSNPLISAVDLDQFLTKDAFLPSKAFMEYFSSVFTGAQVIFPSASNSVIKFKESLKNVLGLEGLTQAQHRKINRLLLDHILTAPGTKFGDMFLSYSKQESITGVSPTSLLRKDVSDNIAARLNKMMFAYPAMQANEFLTNIQFSTSDTDNRLLKVEFRPKGAINSQRSSAISDGLNQLIYSPELFLPDTPMTPQELEAKRIEIAQFGHMLIQVGLVSSRFMPSGTSYMKYVDPQYWSDENGIGVVGEFRKNIISVLEDENHFMDAEFLIEFVRNYGVSLGFVPKASSYGKIVSQLEGSNPIRESFGGVSYQKFLIRNPDAPTFVKGYRKLPKQEEGQKDKTVLYIKVGQDTKNSYYIQLQTKSMKNKLYEMNMRLPSHAKGNGSVIPGRDVGMKDVSPLIINEVQKMINQSAVPTIYSEDSPQIRKYRTECKFGG